MDFKDFKSSCRALITSEVGSIPTRSRQVVVWLAATAWILAHASSVARAAERPDLEDPETPLSTASPNTTMFRSLAFPGWGQLENSQPEKAALVFAVETGLLAAGYIEWQRADHSRDEEAAAAAAGDEAAAAEHYQRYVDRRDRAITNLWWGGFTILISMLDAYVSAHLRDFTPAEVPWVPDDLEPAPPSSPPAARPAPGGETPPAAAPADTAHGKPVSALDPPGITPIVSLNPWELRLGITVPF